MHQTVKCLCLKVLESYLEKSGLILSSFNTLLLPESLWLDGRLVPLATLGFLEVAVITGTSGDKSQTTASSTGLGSSMKPAGDSSKTSRLPERPLLGAIWCLLLPASPSTYSSCNRGKETATCEEVSIV